MKTAVVLGLFPVLVLPYLAVAQDFSCTHSGNGRYTDCTSRPSLEEERQRYRDRTEKYTDRIRQQLEGMKQQRIEEKLAAFMEHRRKLQHPEKQPLRGFFDAQEWQWIVKNKPGVVQADALPDIFKALDAGRTDLALMQASMVGLDPDAAIRLWKVTRDQESKAAEPDPE